MKLIVAQLLSKVPVFSGTRVFIAMYKWLNLRAKWILTTTCNSFLKYKLTWSIPVVAPSKAVYGHSPAETVRFNPAGGNGYLFLVSVVCCQAEVCATSWSHVYRSPSDCSASLCVMWKPQEFWGHGPRWAEMPLWRAVGIDIILNSALKSSMWIFSSY
jgi:hypothetical protein